MTRGDLLAREPSGITPELFPDQLTLQGLRIDLTYRLDPGGPEDGITATVPLAALNQLAPAVFDWLVPGMLQEKIVALIKSLPKHLRVNFVPAPQTAEAAIEVMQPYRGSLLEALATELTKISGVDISPREFNPQEVPDYLRMHFRVIDEAGKVVATGRDLAELQHSLGEQASAAFATMDESEFHRDGLTSWDFGDLPEKVLVKRKGSTLPGYPALIDQGKSVSLRLFDTAAKAASPMRAGVRRLYMLEFVEELRQLMRLPGVPAIQTMCAQYATLPFRGTCELAVDRVFLAEDPTIRTHMEFEVRKRERWVRLEGSIQQSAARVTQILAAYHALMLSLPPKTPPSWDVTMADVNEQLAMLLYPRFIVETPFGWLQQFPRYLKAVQLRLQKLTNAGLDRDLSNTYVINPYLDRYKFRRAQHLARGFFDPELEYFRWMIEELRVSTFAQELGAAVPVSAKRMEAQWAKTTP
jgi:ATP-dependent helicase HrpA